VNNLTIQGSSYYQSVASCRDGGTTMIKVKHLMDALEADDGLRISVEPVGLTLDLIQWCRVDHVLTHLGPARRLWDWFDEHPDGWDYFRAKYHEHLARGPYRPALQAMAQAAMTENLTLLHTGDDPNHNTAAALHEFLVELQAYTQPE
jgi:uncharacterized protein YeaO (DUF488 family)